MKLYKDIVGLILKDIRVIGWSNISRVTIRT